MPASRSRQRTALVLGIALVIGGCDLFGGGSFVDFDAFDPLPPLGRLDLDDGLAQQGIVYWELRLGRPELKADEVIAQAGAADPSDFGPDVQAAWVDLRVQFGLGQACLPGNCSYYLAGLSEAGVLRVWDSQAEVREVLVPVESPSEAALLALGEGYD